VTRAQLIAALQSMKAQVDAIKVRITRDVTPPTVPAIKATGGVKLVSVSLTTPSTDAGGL
jgi:hypothetical protein